jgi:hypothetical protein
MGNGVCSSVGVASGVGVDSEGVVECPEVLAGIGDNEPFGVSITGIVFSPFIECASKGAAIVESTIKQTIPPAAIHLHFEKRLVLSVLKGPTRSNV